MQGSYLCCPLPGTALLAPSPSPCIDAWGWGGFARSAPVPTFPHWTCDVTIAEVSYGVQHTRKVCLVPINWAAEATCVLTHPLMQNASVALGGTWDNDKWVFTLFTAHSFWHHWHHIHHGIMTHCARKGNGTVGHLVYCPNSPKLFFPLSSFSLHIWDPPHWPPIGVTSIWFYFILLFHPPPPFVFSYYIILTDTR